MISKNREDYLRAIYCINEQKEGTVRSIEIVKYLKISKPAISVMLKKLKQQKYIKMEPYLGISFTNKGFKEAQKLTYKHRISELFLRDVLNIDGKDIHEEAHKLEHALSDKVVKKMANFLDNPNVCPCGHKIPNII
ncbi:metal-dependent transcriptional regulator [Candidatus Gracilibacteria bacterium]|nr:metal-dependent transcriptional regulator [Candidatus Gracilibacteria bacterium]